MLGSVLLLSLAAGPPVSPTCEAQPFEHVDTAWLDARTDVRLTADRPHVELWEAKRPTGGMHADLLAREAAGQAPLPVRSGRALHEARAPTLDDHLWARGLLRQAKEETAAQTAQAGARVLHDRQCVLLDEPLRDFAQWAPALSPVALYLAVSPHVQQPTIVDGMSPPLVLIPRALADADSDDGQQLVSAAGLCLGAQDWTPPRAGTPAARYAALAEACRLSIATRADGAGANSSCTAVAVRTSLLACTGLPRRLARSDAQGMSHAMGRLRLDSWLAFARKLLMRARPALLVHTRLALGPGSEPELEDAALILAAVAARVHTDVLALARAASSAGPAGWLAEDGWGGGVRPERLRELLFNEHEHWAGGSVYLAGLPHGETDLWALHPEARKSDRLVLLVRSPPRAEPELRAWASHVSRAFDEVLVQSAAVREQLIDAGVLARVTVVPTAAHALVNQLVELLPVLSPRLDEA